MSDTPHLLRYFWSREGLCFSRYLTHFRVYLSMSWKKFFKKFKYIVDDISETLSNQDGKIYPPMEDMFDMFSMLSPKDIKVVIVGQSPYPSKDACGIPFVTSSGKVTKSLENIRKELMLEYPYLNISSDINGIIRSWVKQGVFLLNMSLTTGTETEDHSVMWEEFIREVIKYITKRDIPVILMGSVAWAIDTKHPIRVPHPVARDGKFLGCNVFLQCNELLDEPIRWASF